KIDEPYWGFGGGGGFDDEYDDDDDEFDFAPPTGRPSGFNVTSDVQHKIKALGGIPAELRREMEKALPRSMGTLGKIYLDVVEECLVKNIPEDQWDEVFERKMENLSFFEKMKIMASMTMNGLPFGGSDDEEDDRPTRSSRSKKRKK
ncbi:MAG: hypothetical protein FWD31_08565, partial [Planctomycetaceae bacterium]|nr:hypothetical protein [Planctomycetaceae bacterium]